MMRLFGRRIGIVLFLGPIFVVMQLGLLLAVPIILLLQNLFRSGDAVAEAKLLITLPFQEMREIWSGRDY